MEMNCRNYETCIGKEVNLKVNHTKCFRIHAIYMEELIYRIVYNLRFLSQYTIRPEIREILRKDFEISP